MILLLPPQCSIRVLHEHMQRNGYSAFTELEPAAGCRRFKLTGPPLQKRTSTMSCDTCHHWTVRRETIYGNGETIVNWEAPSGKGHCESLGIETDSVFGCNRFLEGGGDHIEQKRKPGQPFQHFVMIDCPDCGGKGDGGRGHRCAGTGKVRLYDDGYIGDEQTRTHPKEIPVPSNCFKCSAPVNKEWAHCPACGTALWIEGEFEVVSDMDAGLPPPEPPHQIEGPQ